MSSAAWSTLAPPAGLLSPEVKAPVPAPGAAPDAYVQAFHTLLDAVDIPRGTLDTAVSNASTFLHGAQTVVETGNLLIVGDPSASRVQELSVRLLRSFTLLLQESRAAYVLSQVADISASQLGPPPEGVEMKAWPRLKDFMTPLEAFLERLGVSSRMDVPRLAQLVVHLDDLYDDASLQLQRFFGLVETELDSARLLFPEFLRRFHSDFIRASLADHLLGGVPERDPKEKAGLVALIPELVQALE